MMTSEPTAAGHSPIASQLVRVVLFSGGRGSGALSQRLVRDPSVALTIAINGYDDGASTGRVRRFLGDCLGPSDFRKNASHLAGELSTCEPALIELLDFRLPVGCTASEARDALQEIGLPAHAPQAGSLGARLRATASAITPERRTALLDRLGAFEAEETAKGRSFDFSDCAIGNLVFAGAFLRKARRFNDAIDDYCAVVGLRTGLVENVTDGTNAFLVALDVRGELLATEEAIVDAKRRNQIREIYLLASALDSAEQARLATDSPEERATNLEGRSQVVHLNPRLAARIADADLIIYAPGTQHSSLFPSYVTPGLSPAIAANLVATKLLITNLQTDAEIAGSSAVDIVERAVYYLKEKGRLRVPTPVLITHYLINEPDPSDSGRPYVPMGRIDALGDPRLVRIGHYEDGVTGRHDAWKLLDPFLEDHLARRRPPRVAVVLHDVDSQNKLWQTLLEMIRGGVMKLDAGISVIYGGPSALDLVSTSRLPFPVVHIDTPAADWDTSLWRHLGGGDYDYVILFESSGMYRGEDIISLISPLLFGRLSAVWGSRRLSVRDMEESNRLRYRHHFLLRAASAVGSYALSIAYLLLWGRYVSDTLSGARGIRTSYFLDAGVRLTDKQANQELLSMLMRRRAEFQEVYVRFVPLSPERVKRTTVVDGLVSLARIVQRRLSSPPSAPTRGAA
jgi:2-phospho-L-lactate transferase/gluconeogenesis factor (CofD/UPF0052 family)/ribulose bisphosphate carboxylase small subunit